MTDISASSRHERAVQSLLELPRYLEKGADAYRPGLERINALLDVMGRPERRYPILHVAGTNGKGSVASFAASILSSAGLRVGLHTSPHLMEIGERMRVHGVPAPRDWLGERVADFRREMNEIRPSFFEMTVALSLLYFAESNVDAAVVEVGLGGRLDATNAILPEVCIITNIGSDHAETLGESIAEVATEKAGIIKQGTPVVVAVDEESNEVIRKIADTRMAPFENVRLSCSAESPVMSMLYSTVTVRTPHAEYRDVVVDLPMLHQVWNAVLALRSVETFASERQMTYDSRAYVDGLRSVHVLSGLRGRFEVLAKQPMVIADVAHNADGIAAVLAHLSSFAPARLYVCLALMKDKTVHEIAKALLLSNACVMAVGVESERAFHAARLAAMLKRERVHVDNLETVGKAVERFQSVADPGDVLLVTGSHLAVAESLKLFRFGGSSG